MDNLPIIREEAKKHLELLGYQVSDTIYLADFVGKGVGFPKVNPRRWDIHFNNLDTLEQDPNKGLYCVVNGQGHKDENVQYGRAVFIEHDLKDGLTKEEQKNLWQKLNIPEPTFQVETRNSIHQYWVFTEQVNVNDWKELINDLIIYTKADPANKNPSRVLRLAGSWHIAKDKEGNDLESFSCKIIASSGKQYSYSEMRNSIPRLKVLISKLEARPNLFTPESTPNPIPLEQLCAVNHRDIIKCGVSSGGRNNALSKLARDLLGCESWCRGTSTYYIGDARSLLVEANNRFSPPLSEKELDTIWKSALKGNPAPCLSEDKLLNCLDAWLRPKRPPETKFLPQGEPRNIWQAPEVHNGELGDWTKKKVPKLDEVGNEEKNDKGEIIQEWVKVFEPKANFDFDIVDYLECEDESAGGYKISLQQTGNVRKEFLIRSLDTSVPKDFINALKRGYRCDLICILNAKEIGSLLQVKLQKYYDNDGKRHILAPCRGKQSNGYWVFENRQFDPKGNICTSKESNIVYNPSYGEGDDIPSPQICPPNKEILGKILKLAKEVMGNKGFMPTFFTVAYVTMGLFYDEIRKHHGYFPMLNCTGDASCGKTSSVELAQSFIGLGNRKGAASSNSKSMLYEILARCSCLMISIDDPPKDNDFEESIKGLYNGLARTVRGNYQLPRSSLIITSNHPMGESSSAISSRFLFNPYFKIKGYDYSKESQLKDLLKEASGAFGQLISFGYDHKKSRELSEECSGFLVGAGSINRSSESLGMLTYYALKLAPFAGLTEKDVKDYVTNDLCATSKQSNANIDSLIDFTEKLEILKGKSLIGEWDYRVVIKTSDGLPYIAVVLDSVWAPLTKEFNVVYGKGTIRELVVKSGGFVVKERQRFYINKVVVEAWEKAKLDPNSSMREPQKVPKTCILIPILDPQEDLQENDQEIGKRLLDNLIEKEIFTNDTEVSSTHIEIESPTTDKQEDVQQLDKQVIDVVPIQENTAAIKALIARFEQVMFKEDIDAIWLEYSTTPKLQDIFNQVWDSLPYVTQSRILALRRGVIKQVKNTRKFIVPKWVLFEAGQLVVYQEKLYWFTGIPTDLELTPKQRQTGGGWISLLEVNKHVEINAPIEEIIPWYKDANVNTT